VIHRKYLGMYLADTHVKTSDPLRDGVFGYLPDLCFRT
jgi:hypothetical protein